MNYNRFITKPLNTMQKKHTIIVLGSTNTDMVIRSRRIPAPGETVSETECRAKFVGGRLCFWGGASGRGTLAAVRGFLERKLGVKRTGPGIEDVEFVQQVEMPVREGEEWRFPQ